VCRTRSVIAPLLLKLLLDESRKRTLRWSVTSFYEWFWSGPKLYSGIQGKAKKTRKFAAVKRLLNPKDIRLSVIYVPSRVNWSHALVSGRRTS
jgi:hypothetical protein